MKRAVVSTGLHDTDIRPKPLFSEFKRLSIEGARTFFSDPETLVEVACPACGAEAAREAFRKHEFRYVRCADCASVYVAPRPSRAALDRYYQTSAASHYRVEHFARETATARRRHLLRLHTQWMGRLIDETGAPMPPSYVDVGTNSMALFAELKALDLFESIATRRPLPGLEDEFSAAGVTVIDEGTGFSVVSAFEQLEHQFSPLEFAREAFQMLAPGGVFFFATRSVSGFDLQMLWDKAPYIFVPEHLNLLSIEGLERLVERAGFTLVELSTPGQLDVELVLQTLAEDTSITLPPFVDYLLRERGPEAHADLQAYLQKHRLSSHVRIAAQKPDA